MLKDQLPIYQIQDFKAKAQHEHYFYLSDLATHLHEHLFTQKPHKHNFYIILLFTQGTGTHTIDFKTYEVKPNQLFFLKPGQVHSWDLSANANGLIVFFTAEFYLQEFPHRKLYHFPFFNALLYQPVLNLSISESDGLLPAFERLKQEYERQEIMRNEMLGSQLNMMLIALTRLFQKKIDAPETQNANLLLLQNLEVLLEQHFREHLPVTFYAEKLNITTKHLNELCKSALGKTTTEIIQDAPFWKRSAYWCIQTSPVRKLPQSWASSILRTFSVFLRSIPGKRLNNSGQALNDFWEVLNLPTLLLSAVVGIFTNNLKKESRSSRAKPRELMGLL